MKILVIALSGIGDALMFTPALKQLKKDLPNSQVDALVMYGGVKDIYSRLPEISNVYHFNFLTEQKTSSLKYILNLRKKYDASISVYPSNRIEYNAINWLIGAKNRLAAKYDLVDFVNLGFLNNLRVEENRNVHNVETNFKLVQKLTGAIQASGIPDLQFPLQNEEKEFSEKFLKKNNIAENDMVIGIHPGCSTLKNHIKRRWEPKKFATLAKRLITENSSKILVFGGPEEDELKSDIQVKVGSDKCLNVRTTNLVESAAVMKRCNVFITNDSSLMHVASAMKLNVVAIIGPTNTGFIKPWNTNHKIVSLNLDCSPCFFYSPKPLICSRTDKKFKCIRDLDVDMVYREVLEFIFL